MDTQSFFSKTYIQVLLTLVLVGAVLSLGAYTHYTLKQAQGVYTGNTTINVRGEGEALARPDIGTFSFGVQTEGVTAEAAQTASAEITNRIMTYLTEAGVEEKDITTENYSLNPRYRYESRPCPAGGYCPSEQIEDGFEVYQWFSVKVRDLDQAGALIAGVGERGATNLSGLSFTIDDDTALQAEARAAAIADAKAKAAVLAEALDVRIVRMVGFYEENGNMMYPMYERSYAADAAVMESSLAPNVATGESSYNSVVNITYEVR